MFSPSYFIFLFLVKTFCRCYLVIDSAKVTVVSWASILHMSWNQGHGIHGFKDIWNILINEDLGDVFIHVVTVLLSILLSPFIKNIFDGFDGGIIQFALIKFTNYATLLHVHSCNFKIIHKIKQYTTCQLFIYLDTTIKNGCLPRIRFPL